MGRYKPHYSTHWYYIHWSSIFDSSAQYDVEKFTEVLRRLGAKNVRTERQFGWHNQPEVVCFQYSADMLKVRELHENFCKEISQEWIIFNRKEWKAKRHVISTLNAREAAV